MTIVLLVACTLIAFCFWIVSAPQFIRCELFELSDKGGAEEMSITKRKRRVYLFKELPLFFCCQMIGVLWRKIRKRFSSGMTCCYKIPHYAGIVGGNIPTRLYVGTSTQLVLSFP